MAGADDKRTKGPSVTRRAALVGAGLGLGAALAGPLALALPAEVAEAATPYSCIADRGHLHYPAYDPPQDLVSGSPWFTSDRGEAMFCINRHIRTYNDNYSGGTVCRFTDGAAFGLFDRDVRKARAVAWIIERYRGYGTTAWERTYAQVAIWMVLEWATVSWASWSHAFNQVWGASNQRMDPASSDIAAKAWAFGQSGDSSLDRRLLAFIPSGGGQPVGYYNPILTEGDYGLWMGVSAAATNGHPVADGVYMLRCEGDASYHLATSSDRNADGGGHDLMVWTSYSGDSWRTEEFHLRYMPDSGAYQMRPLVNGILSVDARNGSAGQAAHTYWQNGTDSQLFHVEPCGDGTFRLCPRRNADLALTAAGYRNGAEVTLEAKSDSLASQRWRLERVDTSTGGFAKGTVDSYDRPLAGAVWGVYHDESCSSEWGRMTTGADGWAKWPDPWDEVNDDWYVRMISAPAGYRKDVLTHRFRITEDHMAYHGKCRPWLYTSLEPDTYAVSFYVVDLDGTCHLVHKAVLASGSAVAAGAACVADADASARREYPEDFDYLRRWYRDVATLTALGTLTLAGDVSLFARRPGAVHFLWLGSDGSTWTEVHSAKAPWLSTVSSSDDTFAEADARLARALDVEVMDYVGRWYSGKGASDGKFASAEVRGEVYVYARPSWGTVTHYVDGTGPESVVRMPDGTRATFGPFAWGHRYVVDAAVTEAARADGCTPGLAAWYADAADPWVASDQEPATPATSGSFAESVLVDRAETPLYATNRLTLSFALADGSVDAAAEPELHVAADASSEAATVALPSPVVVRRLRSRSLSGFDQAYAPTEGGRWRTLRPRAWYGDAAATGTPSLTVRPTADGTLYALWRWNTADGVVDDRG